MNTIRRLGTILVVAVALTGCQKEILTPDNGTKDLGREIELTMSASMSDVVIPSRALTEAEEKAITRLDVLVFNENDTFAYTVQANTPTVSGSTLSYTVRLKKSTASEKYKLVLLANLDAAPTISVGTAKEAAMAAITFTTNIDWRAGGKIPMWADYPTAAMVSTSTTNTSFGTTAVIRSLARVNVSNLATSTFILTDVWIYNSTYNARVAPVFSNYDATSKKVTAPSPATNAGIRTAYSKSATSNALVREIYISEAAQQAVGSSSAVCLVLQGNYGGAINFYRVDMVASDGKTPLDILRNHTYNVNITKVAGSGYSTKEDAFKSMPINMTVDIKVWNDANLSDITDDGQYHLAVDKASVEVNGIAGKGSIAYTTNHPTVTVTKTTDTWLTISSGNASPIEFSYEKNSNMTDARTAKIIITAGRIVKEITVTQAPKPEVVYAGMFGGAMIGAGTESNPYRFSQPLYVQATDESTSIKWAEATGDHSLLAGSKTDGRANTWKLNGNSSTNFPAANLCFKKNDPTLEQASEKALVWYLPAQGQLMGIWITHNGSGASFASLHYWSSSENGSNFSWYVDFNSGDTGIGGKTGRRPVRCVREVTP